MADDRMAALELLRKAAGDGDLDFLREGLTMLTQLVMDVEVSAQIGATHGERVPERRLTQRNGYRERRWDTRVGTIDLQIPKLRDGTYFPSLLEPRRRAERALLAVVQEAYVGGVSTRRVEELVGALGIVNLSRSEVSRICAGLDAEVDAFRSRPLDRPWPSSLRSPRRFRTDYRATGRLPPSRTPSSGRPRWTREAPRLGRR